MLVSHSILGALLSLLQNTEYGKNETVERVLSHLIHSIIFVN